MQQLHLSHCCFHVPFITRNSDLSIQTHHTKIQAKQAESEFTREPKTGTMLVFTKTTKLKAKIPNTEEPKTIMKTEMAVAAQNEIVHGLEECYQVMLTAVHCTASRWN